MLIDISNKIHILCTQLLNTIKKTVQTIHFIKLWIIYTKLIYNISTMLEKQLASSAIFLQCEYIIYRVVGGFFNNLGNTWRGTTAWLVRSHRCQQLILPWKKSLIVNSGTRPLWPWKLAPSQRGSITQCYQLKQNNAKALSIYKIYIMLNTLICIHYQKQTKLKGTLHH